MKQPAQLSWSDWVGLEKRGDAAAFIQESFGGEYKLRAFEPTGEGRVPVLEDSKHGLAWVFVPPGIFSMGLSDSEREAALRLSPSPFLTFAEMGPVHREQVRAFLILQEAVTVAQLPPGIAPVDSIGSNHVALIGRDAAIAVSKHYEGSLPYEREWEYACRGGTKTLFWFGDTVPRAPALERILGLVSPAAANGFGLKSLFHGEWCEDPWRPTYQAEPALDRGHCVRGGASRFWPWQDPREWAGCVSSFRIPSADVGDAGLAARLVRRL